MQKTSSDSLTHDEHNLLKNHPVRVHREYFEKVKIKGMKDLRVLSSNEKLKLIQPRRSLSTGRESLFKAPLANSN